MQNLDKSIQETKSRQTSDQKNKEELNNKPLNLQSIVELKDKELDKEIELRKNTDVTFANQKDSSSMNSQPAISKIQTFSPEIVNSKIQTFSPEIVNSKIQTFSPEIVNLHNTK